MITNGPSWSWEYEEKEYGLKKLKRNNPDEYASYVNKLNNLYSEIERRAIEQRKKHNGHH